MNSIKFSQYFNVIKEYFPLEIQFPWEKYVFGAATAAVGVLFYRQYVEGGQFKKDDVKMYGKVVIITGANTGIGKETAMDLARRNAKIYLACRDFDRCEAARKEIIEKTGNHQVFNRHLDLSDQKSVRDFAEEFSKEEEKLDVLINNAGALYLPHSLTVDGIEIHLAVNHISHFLLTHLLLDHLKTAPQGRIVNVSSLGYASAKIDKNDLHLQKSFDEMIAYCNTKLAQVFTTQRLAKELQGTNVTVNCLHPGVIMTEIFRHKKISRIVELFVFPLLRFMVCKSLKSGAQTTIRCAVDPELATVSGKYFSDCEVVEKLKGQANDEDLRDFIWRESLSLAKIPANFSYK